jgi:polyisoprenoid-binding protein YceI
MSWKIDPAHSNITFSVRHMMISNVHGRFENFNGSVEGDEADPTNARIEVQIDAASINTKEPQRDGHLKSPDFFNAEKFPYITFKSFRIERLAEHKMRLHGDLTIREVTQPVVLDVEYAGMAKSPWGSTSAGFTASTQINRKDWGLEWNVALETGGWLVGDMININIELELIKQPELQAVAN